MTAKLTAYASSLRDGGEAVLKEKSWERNKIVKTPSVLQFLSFSFYYGGVLIGPAFEYRQYAEWIESGHPKGIMA